MTASQLADIVRAYLVRGSKTFETVGGIDVVLDAINGAKRSLQKKVDWFLLHQQTTVTVPVEGLDISLTANGAFKRIDEVYAVNEDGGVGARLDFRSLSQLNSNQETIFNENTTPVYQLGKKIFVNNATSDTELILIGYQFLPDYVVNTNEEDLFTEYAEDYLKAFAFRQLQTYKKDDERAYITKAQLDDEYRALLLWNASLVRGQQDWDLS